MYSSGSAGDGQLGFNGFFYTGPTSRFDFNTEQLAAQDAKPDGKPDEKIETSSVAVDSKESEVTPAPEKKDDATTASPEGKDVDSKDPEVVVALINEQLLSGAASGFGSPYPIFRFGGSASYYPDLSTPFSGFAGFSGYSGYQAPHYFRPQYEPSNNYFPYQSGSNPLFPSSLQGDFYNPTFPFVYQHPGVATSTSTETGIPLIDKRVNGHDGSEAKTEDKTGAPETTTEEIVTKSDDTATSEASPTAAEPKESTTSEASPETSTVADSAAVP